MAKVIVTIEDIDDDWIDAHVEFDPEANFASGPITPAQRMGRQICALLHNAPGDLESVEIEDGDGNVTKLYDAEEVEDRLADDPARGIG